MNGWKITKSKHQREEGMLANQPNRTLSEDRPRWSDITWSVVEDEKPTRLESDQIWEMGNSGWTFLAEFLLILDNAEMNIRVQIQGIIENCREPWIECSQEKNPCQYFTSKFPNLMKRLWFYKRGTYVPSLKPTVLLVTRYVEYDESLIIFKKLKNIKWWQQRIKESVHWATLFIFKF